MPVLIIGCGATGRRAAAHYLQQDETVTGLVRSEQSAAQLRAAGIQPLCCDLDADAPLTRLPQAHTVLYAAPPPRNGDDDPRLARVLSQLDPAAARLVYISTSGVYGDCGGDWVSEDRLPAPTTPRARRRVAAEARVLAWPGRAAILRAPGIYGPGRLPFERVRNGGPALRDADSPWTNRIHVEDLARAAVAAAQPGAAGGIYNAADGQPLRMAAYYGLLARHLGVPAPATIDRAEAEQHFSAMRLSFLRDSRRLCNRRLVTELGLSLRYPDLASALAAGAV